MLLKCNSKFTTTGLAALLCLASIWAPPAQAQSVVNIVDTSPRVDQFEFRRSASPGIALGSGFYVVRNRHQGEAAKVRWTKSMPLRGRQELKVLAHVLGAADPRLRTTQARFQIFHADGIATVTINQQKSRSEWIMLGVFPFKPGDATVILTDVTGESTGEKLVVANAIRWVNP